MIGYLPLMCKVLSSTSNIDLKKGGHAFIRAVKRQGMWLLSPLSVYMGLSKSIKASGAALVRLPDGPCPLCPGFL